MRRTGIGFTTMAAIATFCVAGCSTASSPIVVTTSLLPDAGRMEAQFEGRVAVDEATSCVYGESGGGRIGLIFEEGATMKNEQGPVQLPGGAAVPLGEPVMLAGGYVTWEASDGRCPFQENFLVNGVSGQ